MKNDLEKNRKVWRNLFRQPYGGEDSTELFKEVHAPASHYAPWVEGLTIGTIVETEPHPEIVAEPPRVLAVIPYIYIFFFSGLFNY